MLLDKKVYRPIQAYNKARNKTERLNDDKFEDVDSMTKQEYAEYLRLQIELTKRDLLDMIDTVDALDKISKRCVGDHEPINGYYEKIKLYRDNGRKTIYKLITREENLESILEKIEG